MSMINRAAQFSPFAALSGYGEAVSETERLTEEKASLDSSVIEEINRKLVRIAEDIDSKPYVTIIYFVRDPFKPGGTYVTLSGNVRKIDEIERVVIMEDRTRIEMDDIFDII